jgi:catechol 2,3-dioxygenase-like lactoylglutathione lyase family enzyme
MSLDARPQPTSVEIVGIHHVSLPTSDVEGAMAWYVDILGFECVLVEEEEASVIGALLVHPTRAVISLHADPDRARALSGFAPVGLTVHDLDALNRWGDYLSQQMVEHSAIYPAHVGFAMNVHGPDGINIQLHTLEELSAEST